PLTDDPLGIESQVTERTRTASPALWRWLAIVAAAVLALESQLSLLKQRRVVRRRWRLPSALAVLAVVAVLLAALGVPVPGSGPTNTIAWVGDHDPRPAVGGNAPVEWISSA